MRNAIDFKPYRQSSIGFDRLFDMLERTAGADQQDGYPPYDVEQLREDAYRITIAVAGFGRDEIDITTKPNVLLVSGRKQEGGEHTYLHRGIATRAFERQFQLGDYVVVRSASLNDGLLRIDLEREVPEEVKPRKIEIGEAKPAQRQVGNDTRQGEAA